MSEFDKEAEREKLREKYEQEQQDRAATEHMSQLLLQGATMTNHHCDECGDPRFRYDGREFCPTCEGVEGGEPVDETGGDEANAGEETTATTQEATDAPQQSGQQPQVTQQPRPTGEQAPQPAQQPGQPRQPSQAESQQSAHGAQTAQPTADSDLATARATLAQSVRALAERGAAADDPRRAKELLAAAREAAEALAALQQ
jgi:uncharacterized Zn finger protein (UPF0148 family)